MSYVDFNPFGTDSVIVRFPCDDCGELVESEHIFVPEPNYMAEKARDSYVENDGYGACSCGKQFTLWINSGYAGGYIQILDYYGDEEEIDVEEIPEEYHIDEFEAILSNTRFYETYQDSIRNLSRLNEIDTGEIELDNILNRQIWVSVITTMETYLSDALINTILAEDNLKKTFVRHFKDFGKRKFVLNELYRVEEKIDTIIKNELSEIIYHNLPKLNGIYKDTLDIDFGDFEVIQRAVLKRHDIVHRNGRDEDGKIIHIQDDDINQLINEMNIFIANIDEQLNRIVPNEG